MALTVAGGVLTKANQAAQLAARAGPLQELVHLWSIVDIENLTGTIDTFARAAAILAGAGFDQSAAAAANYYSLFRRVEGIGSIVVPPAARPAAEVLAGQLRGAALAGIIASRRSGASMPEAGRQGFIRTAGEMTKLVLSGGRMTIIGAAQTDPKALGWTRVVTGDPCAFCRALAGRGPVYKSERTADFQAHDHCTCTAEPVYRGKQDSGSVPADSARYLAEYRTAQEWARDSGTMSQDTSNNALNNYRRWLANGSPAPGQPTDGVPGNG